MFDGFKLIKYAHFSEKPNDKFIGNCFKQKDLR